MLLEPEQDVQYTIDEIKNSHFANFNDVKDLWMQTVKYRLNFIQKSHTTKDIIAMWKNYTMPYGFKLVNPQFVSH